MKKEIYLSLLVGLVTVLAYSCSKEPPSGEDRESDNGLLEQAALFFRPIRSTPVQSADNPLSEAKTNLGKILFFDARLSRNNTVSCASCHNLSNFGVDNAVVSAGHGGQLGNRNSPTVLNAAFHFRQFWDGRSATVEQQAGIPILNPIEMALPDRAALETKLSSIELYQRLFSSVYTGEANPVTFENATNSIGAFVRTLVTPSRFDTYLNGDRTALTATEKEGLRTFIQTGCTNCHSGQAIGGATFQKFGVFDDYFRHTNSTRIDNGRFDITGEETDRYVFKVPSLRNAARTGPYFHDGSVVRLEDAVTIMARINLNRSLSDREVSSIVSFINSTTAALPTSVAQRPSELP